jgi:hypothetical protein
MSLCLAYGGEWPDMTCRSPGGRAWGPKLQFLFQVQSKIEGKVQQVPMYLLPGPPTHTSSPIINI